MKVNRFHAHLYSVRGGKLSEDYGEVSILPGSSRGIFQSENSSGRRIYCALHPGEVYNGTVWFDKKGMRAIAMTKLAEYEQDRIFEISNQLRAHEKKLGLVLGSSCRKG